VKWGGMHRPFSGIQSLYRGASLAPRLSNMNIYVFQFLILILILISILDLNLDFFFSLKSQDMPVYLRSQPSEIMPWCLKLLEGGLGSICYGDDLDLSNAKILRSDSVMTAIQQLVSQ
jgi:hypothetical protein